MNEAIKVKDFSKIFKDFKSLDNISFTVDKNSIHAFVGPNGSGKTTTIKSLIGAYITKKTDVLELFSNKNGTILANQNIGYVPEKASFPANMSAYEYLKWMGRLSNMKDEDIEDRINYYLKKMNLWDKKDKNPTLFSSGMQKKILIIQSILHQPKLLILDEPTANLDPSARDDVIKLLIELNKKEKMTIFISSHILSELERFIDSITFLHFGKIIYSGKVSELYDKYGSDFYIKTSNNDLLTKLLKLNKINNFEIYEDKLIINKSSILEINNIIKICLNNNILIETIQKDSLQEIYNKLIKNR